MSTSENNKTTKTIKVPLPLEPNGIDFKVTEARHIAYSNADLAGITNVEDALTKLQATVFATPKLYIEKRYLNFNKALPGPENPNENSEILVPVILTSPSIGECKITIASRKAGAESFSGSKTITKPATSFELELGVATTIADTTYKITAIDGGNKPFEFYTYDSYNFETDEYEGLERINQNFLEINVITGLVNFKSTFEATAINTIYHTSQDNIIYYNFEHTYAKECCEKILTYSLYYDQELIKTHTVKIKPTRASGSTLPTDYFIAAETTTLHDSSFTFNPTETGTYLLVVQMQVNEGSEEDMSINPTATVSKQYALDVMPASTIILKDITSYPAGNIYDSNDFISITVLPKSSSIFDKGTGAITLTGALTLIGAYDLEGNPVQTISGTDFSSVESFKTLKAYITDGERYSWSLGRLLNEQLAVDLNYYTSYKLTFKAGASNSNTQEDTVIYFRVTNSSLTSAEYIRDDSLKLYFDFSNKDSIDPDDNTIILNKAERDNRLINYKLKLVEATADTAIAPTSVTTQVYNNVSSNARSYTEQFDCLNLAGASYAYTIGENAVNGEEYAPKNPWISVAELAQHTNYTFETRIRSSCTGKLNASALALGYTENDAGVQLTGFNVSYNKATLVSNEILSCDLIDNTWHHLCIACTASTAEGDKFTASTEDVSSYNALPTLRIYIDGVLCKIIQHKQQGVLGNINIPMVLNGIYKGLSADGISVANQGELSIQFIRLYNRVLSSTEIYQNYCSSLGNTELLEYVKSKQNLSTAPVVYFVRNSSKRIKTNGGLDKNATDLTATQQYWSDNAQINSTFDTLHKIKTKKADDISIPTSKNTLVNCTMYWRDDSGSIEVIDANNMSVKYNCMPNVDVFLQGTSSLNYPVKNYQIKVFSDDIAKAKRTKESILPPYVSEADPDWQTPSYVYTLKCDYMEQSHRNNTPTACYYQDQVLPKVIEYCSNKLKGKSFLGTVGGVEEAQYSPARRILNNMGQPVYRDAINGFPCIVYYQDTVDEDFIYDGTNHSFNPTSAAMCYAGTYMFNVDKEGDQLGFTLDTETCSNIISGEAGASYALYRNANGLIIDDTGTLLTNQSEGAELTTEYPCTSYEGATNDNYSAAAFIPFDIQRSALLANKYETAETVFDSTSNKVKKRFYYRLLATKTSDGSDTPELIYPLHYAMTEDRSEYLRDPDCFEDFETLTDFVNAVKSKDTITLDTIDNQQNRHFYDVYNEAEHNEVYGADEDEYYEKTLEPRYTFAKDAAKSKTKQLFDDTDFIKEKILDQIGLNEIPSLPNLNLPEDHRDVINYKNYKAKYDEVYKETYNSIFYPAAYTPIKNAINWVYQTVTAIENATEENKTDKINIFKQDFKKYFSFEYCLAYYLQLLAFTQVDNAGKNAMFDTWGDGRLYPRPYDMDTQMGLDNSGNDNRPVSAELHYDLSPLAEGKSSVIGISNWQKASSKTHERFNAYTTNRSYLWKSFGKYFKAEIAGCYAYLRDTGVYSVDNIYAFVNSKTSDVIGEQFYNDDSVLKYLKLVNTLGQPSDAYYYCVNGSRKDRYFNFLQQRLVFLDTLLGYTNGLNGQIDIRADANKATSYLGLMPYSPQYTKIQVDQSASAWSFLEPTDRYLNNDQKTYSSGIKVTVPTAGTNKNIYITGAGNLQAIRGLDTLNTTVLQIQDAINLAEIKLAGTPISTLSFGDNKYLTHLDLSKMTNLTSSLDLSQCINLQYLDIHESGITGVTLPPNCSLNYLDCSNSGIQSLVLNNLPNLTTDNLKLTNCSNLTSLEINNCPNLESSVKKANSAGNLSKYFPLTDLTNLRTFSISGDCSKFKIVELANHTALNSLNITNVACEELYLTDCAGEAFNNLGLANLSNLKVLDLTGTTASDGLGKVIISSENNLQEIYFASSNIGTLGYTQKDHNNESPALIVNDKTLNFEKCENLQKLTLNKNTAFEKLYGLTFTGDLRTGCTDDADGFLSSCSNLTTIDTCNIQTSETTIKINSMFKSCKKLKDITNSEFSFPKVNSAVGIFMDCKNITWPSIVSVLAGLHKSEAASLNLETAFLRACCPESDPSSVDYNADYVNTNYYPIILPATITFNNNNYPTFPNITTSLAQAFSSTKFQELEVGLFDNLFNLQNITKAFTDCSNLYYVPDTLFNYCTRLTSAWGTFYNCRSLGDITKHATVIVDYTIEDDVSTPNFNSNYYPELIGTELTIIKLCNPEARCSWTYKSDTQQWMQDTKYIPPIIFTYNNAVFNSDMLTSVQSLFTNCSKLRRNSESTSTLDKFFEGKNRLVSCVATFAGCANLDFNIDQDSGIFPDCVALQRIDALFYKTALSTLPETIFTKCNATDGFTNLTTAGGLFANCNNLTGLIKENFFSNLPSIQRIGNSKFADTAYYVANGTHLAYPGMFANTKLKVNVKAISGLTTLVDISCLFATGKIDGNTFIPTMNAEQKSCVQFVTDDNGSFTGRVDILDSTSTYANLIDVSYAFAGNSNVQTITASIFDGAANIKNMKGTFANCSNFNNGELHSFFQDKTFLQNTSYMFANCANLSYTFSASESNFFKSCSNLTCCTAMFFNSGIQGSIPASLFNDNRNVISEVNYMFAKCAQLKGIDRGFAIINDPYFYDGSNISYYTTKNLTWKDYFNSESLFKKALIEKAESDNIKHLKNNWFGENEVFDRYRNHVHSLFYETLKLAKGNSDTQFDNKLFTDSDKKTEAEIASIFENCNKDYETSCQLYYMQSNQAKSMTIPTKLEFYFKNTIADIKQPGLLSNCTALTNVEYMFAGCTKLQGAIPADMFYFKDCQPSSNLTSLEGLFQCCYALTCNKVLSSDGNTYQPLEAYDSNFGVVSTVNSTDCLKKQLNTGGNYSKVYPCVLPAPSDTAIKVYKSHIMNSTPEFPTYFVPQDWLTALTNLTSIDNLFDSVGCSRITKEVSERTDKTEGTPVFFTADIGGGTSKKTNIYELLQIPMNMFDQYLINSAKNLFRSCLTIGGTQLTGDFLQNSIENLTDVSSCFEYSLLSGIKDIFISETSNKNTNLASVGSLFHRVNFYNKMLADSSDLAKGSSLCKTNSNGTLESITILDFLNSIDSKNNWIAPELWNREKFTNVSTSTAKWALGGVTPAWANNEILKNYTSFTGSSSSEWGREANRVVSTTWDKISGYSCDL